MKNLMITTLLAVSIGLSAQELDQTQYAAYLTASKSMWQKSVAIASDKYGPESYEKALALYGLLGNTMASQDEDTFVEYKEETIDVLEKIIEANPQWGEPKALLSSTYGLVIAYSPMKGMFLGMKSSSLMEEAMEQQPESALVQKLYGGSKLYTPEMFGGDPKAALKSYMQAKNLYEEGNQMHENWLYLDSLMGLSMAYQKSGEEDKAKDVLRKAIELEPKYYWAKTELAKLEKS